MNKIDEIKEVQKLFSEIKSPEGLTFLEILELIKTNKASEIEPRLISMLEWHEDKTNRLIELLYLDEKLLDLDYSLKFGLILRKVTAIAGALNGN